MSRRSPVPDIVFIVTVERACIEDERFSSLHVCCRVLVPTVSMNQTRFDTPAFALKGIQEPWNDFIQRQIAQLFKFWSRTIFLEIYGKHMGQLLAIKGRPRVFPYLSDLGCCPVAGNGVEAEFSRG